MTAWRRRARLAAIALGASAMLPGPAASAADPGAAALAKASPAAGEARRELQRQIAALHDANVRRETLSALFEPGDCIRTRAGLTVADQDAIIAALRARGWIDQALSPDQARAGLFPPLEGEGGACPRSEGAALAAPGGNFGSHHSWPGGLTIHIAVNLRSGMALLDAYRDVEQAAIDRDMLAGAILWHDWAKSIVLGWRPDGTTEPEIRVAGTGAHHIIGLAEAMRRGFPPAQIVAQACAHAAPVGDSAARVQSWLDAAAIVARVDGTAYRASATPICLISHLSDQNWIFSDQAIVQADAFLAAEAGAFGFDPACDRARYLRCMRTPVLAWLTAERLFAALSYPDRAKAMIGEALAASAPYSACSGASPADD